MVLVCHSLKLVGAVISCYLFCGENKFKRLWSFFKKVDCLVAKSVYAIWHATCFVERADSKCPHLFFKQVACLVANSVYAIWHADNVYKAHLEKPLSSFLCRILDGFCMEIMQSNAGFKNSFCKRAAKQGTIGSCWCLHYMPWEHILLLWLCSRN